MVSYMSANLKEADLLGRGRSMLIGGFQKVTLLDFPGRVATTVFTVGCNMRCPFCHNPGLVNAIGDTEPEEDFWEYLEDRKKLLDGVCITGGEPLIHDDIEEFIMKIRDKGLQVKLDTNGSFPDRLKSIIDKGLVEYVSMDIKNTNARYPMTVGVPDFDTEPILRSIKIIEESGIDHEFRTTVVDQLHRAEDFREIAGLIANSERYFIQSFKDTGDLVSDNGKDGKQGKRYDPPAREKLDKMLEEAKEVIPGALIRGEE